MYVFRPDPTLVIKVEDTAGSFQNIFEYEMWQWARDTKWKNWFAPAVSISSSGIYLLQKRTGKLIYPPKRVPDFMSDFKVENFGVLDKRVVAHDYGLPWSMRQALNKAKLMPVRWWVANEQ